MAVYAVGDVQGCLHQLQQLLKQVDFDPKHDQLWLVGDLVNRGPSSLATLRFLYQIRHSITIVLGNHDLHLLACYYHRHLLGRKDTLAEILSAPDCSQLMHWLRQQKMFHHDAELGYAMVHAGVNPNWTLEQCLALAAEVEQVLRDEQQVAEFLLAMYGDEPSCWHDDLTGMPRLRLITNYFTRLRFCAADGTLELNSKAGVDQAPIGFAPWFTHNCQSLQQGSLLFGHWAALQGNSTNPAAIALDTGCVWGQSMTLYELDNGKFYRCSCEEFKQEYV